jgi:carboxyl-terminal processing protease
MNYKSNLIKSLVKYILPLTIIFASCITIGFIIGVKVKKFNSSNKKESNISASVEFSRQKFLEAIQIIEKLYVNDIDLVKFTNSTIQDMVEKLDPFSSYIDVKSLKAKEGEDSANHEGIGVNIFMAKGIAQIVSPIQEGPAEEAGIRSGDIIERIDDEDISNRGLNEKDVFNKLLGPKGSKVLIKIKRKSEKDLIDFSVTRGKMPVRYVSGCMINNETGYIKISYFAPNTNKEFSSLINAFLKEGMKKLIIDLRSNAGGEIEEAINVADKLLNRGQLISYTIGKTEAYNTKYYAKSNDVSDEIKLLVMIDHGTAAAAEVLAGALQDNDRAIVVGERSFGRGTIQQPVSMQDGSQMMITVAKLYTPSGRSIQKNLSASFNDTIQDMAEQYKQIGYFRSDTMQIDEKLKYRSVMGRTVFGGGGILPDFIIISDRESKPIFLDKIKPLIKQIAFEYSNQNSNSLAKMEFDNFLQNFETPNIIIDQLRAHADKEGLQYSEAIFRSILPNIKAELKAYIAYNIWKEQAFHIIKCKSDEVLLKALCILKETNILTHEQ